MFESRTVEVMDAGRVEITRSPTRGITAVVQVAATAVTTRVETDGRVGVTVAQEGITIWEYELRAVVAAQARHDGDVNAELRQAASDVLVPPKRGRPPKPPVAKRPSNTPTLAELAERQSRK